MRSITRGRVDLSRRFGPPIDTSQLADAEVRPANDIHREEQITRDLALESRAVSRSLSHRGFDEALNVSRQIEHPTDTGAPIDLVTYTVPEGLVAVVNAVGVFYSEPIVPMTVSVGWRIVVNRGRVPNIIHTGGNEDYYYTSFGDIMDPMPIRELWVQAGQTISIQVRAFFGFDDHLVMIGAMSGRIFKPANPNLISIGGVV